MYVCMYVCVCVLYRISVVSVVSLLCVVSESRSEPEPGSGVTAVASAGRVDEQPMAKKMAAERWGLF